jgi:histone deacetylase 6
MESCGEGAGLGKSVDNIAPLVSLPEHIDVLGQLTYPGQALEWATQIICMRLSKLSCLSLMSSLQNWLYVSVVSAGFDAAAGDDLGECDVTPAGYAHMTHMLSSLAGGKILVALEVSSQIKSCSKR